MGAPCVSLRCSTAQWGQRVLCEAYRAGCCRILKLPQALAVLLTLLTSAVIAIGVVGAAQREISAFTLASAGRCGCHIWHCL